MHWQLFVHLSFVAILLINITPCSCSCAHPLISYRSPLSLLFHSYLLIQQVLLPAVSVCSVFRYAIIICFRGRLTIQSYSLSWNYGKVFFQEQFSVVTLEVRIFLKLEVNVDLLPAINLYKIKERRTDICTNHFQRPVLGRSPSVI